MGIATTTRDTLGLALLAALIEKPSSQAEFDALAHTSRVDAVGSPAHTHCHRIACAQIELDALSGESCEDEGDASLFLPFSP